MSKQQQAFLATIRTSTNETTELIVAASERAAMAEAESRHGADDRSVMISVERLEVDDVVIVCAQAETGTADGLVSATGARSMLPFPFIDIRPSLGRHVPNAAIYPSADACGLRGTALFSAPGLLDPVERPVTVLATYADGRSRVRIDDSGTTALINSTSLRLNRAAA